MNLLMLSGDTAAARGQEGAFSQMLRRFADYWDRIDVICPPLPDPKLRILYEKVYLHPSPWPVFFQPLFILRQGRRLFGERSYGLVISHDYGVFYNGIGAWLLTAGGDVPYVSEIHHVEGYPFALTRRELVYRVWAKFYIRWAAQQAAAIRVVNRTEMPRLLRRWGVPPEKILVLLSLYIDFEIFHPMPAVPKVYDVLFVGRLVSNKGVLRLIEAVAQVKQTHPQVTLCILGTGSLRRTIEKRIAELDLGENVTLIERLDSPHEVARLYNQARMVVCASTSEGGPRVTVEAMACGTPVISTPVGIMQDLMEADGKNFLVSGWGAADLAAKISLLLEDNLLRAQLAENGEIAVQGFRAETIIDQYARGYLDLIARLKGG